MLRGTASSAPPETVVASGNLEPERIGHFCTQHFETLLPSTSQAMKAVRAQRVLLNDTVCGHATIVKPGDMVTLLPPQEISGDTTRAEAFASGLARSEQLWVELEEDEFAIVHKPAGVHTKPYGAPLSLEAALPGVLQPPKIHRRDALPAPVAVHRLDARVAGLVVCAKTRRAAAALAEAFRERQVMKRYRAIALGRVGSPGDELEVTSDIEGRSARTSVKVVEVTPHVQAGCLSTLDLYPHTGRRHQLRRHCGETLGHPLLGDDLYAASRSYGEDEHEHEHGDGSTRRGDYAANAAPGDRAFYGKRSSGLFLQSCEVAFEYRGRHVHVQVEEGRKFARQRERARLGWEHAARGEVSR